MAGLPTPILYDPKHHAHLLPQFAQIHADCVIEDGTMATFLPRADGTMDMAKLLAYWQDRAAAVEAGTLDIAVQLAQDVAVTAETGTEEEVLGYACLHMPRTETGPFRSVVEKLMVSPRHRRKGVARRVMGSLEEVARRKQRGLMTLDTTIGSGAEHVYPRLGYKPLGIIPKYGIHPLTGGLADELFFYKDLRDEE